MPRAFFVLLSPVLAIATVDAQITRPPDARPVDPIAAIAAALQTYSLVGLGEGAHESEQDHAFRVALLRDARIQAVLNDVVTECGNSRYQDIMDRYVRGEVVPFPMLRRVWEDSIVATPICDSRVYRDLFVLIRDVNMGRPAERQLRVLLGGPPIDWDAVRTFADITKWEEGRDRFAADVIRREVVAKGRHALAIFGRMHITAKYERTNFETGDFIGPLLEAEGMKIFKVWTAVGEPDLASIQADVRSWPIPSVAVIRGTQLGATDFRFYFESDGRLEVRDGKVVRIPPDQWRPMRMEDLVDAVLYLGSTVTYSRLPRELCSDGVYMDMRSKRMEMVPGGAGELARLKQYCGGTR